jgi:hypothetical protein
MTASVRYTLQQQNTFAAYKGTAIRNGVAPKCNCNTVANETGA